MPEARKYDLLNLGGGFVDAVPATHLQDSQFQKLENFYAKNLRLIRRKGVELVAAFGINILGIFQIRTRESIKYPGVAIDVTGTFGPSGLPTGTRRHPTDHYICLSATEAMSLDALQQGAEPTPLTVTPTLANFDAASLWTGEQYKEVLYLARRNSGSSLLRCDGKTVDLAGIEAPTTAASLAAQAVGDLEAGDYEVVYTNINLDTLQESNPSPVATVTIAANESIDVTSIDASSNTQVTARRIYRSLKNQSGEWFKSGDFAGRSATATYNDNVLEDDLGDPVSLANDAPPDNIECFIVWKDRGICTDGKDVFIGELGLMESYDEDLVLQVGPEDGHAVVGLHAWGDRCVIGKGDKMLLLTGFDRSDFAVEVLTDRTGCASHHSMKSVEGSLFWYSGDKILRSDGVGVVDISDQSVKEVLKLIPADRMRQVCATVIPEQNWYVLSIPVPGDIGTTSAAHNVNSRYLVYDYKAGVWAVFRHFSSNADTNVPAAQFLAEAFDVDNRRLTLASFAGLVDPDDLPAEGLYELFAGNTDDFRQAASDNVYGNIRAIARTKEFGFEDQGFLKWLRRLWLNCTTVTAGLTLRVYRDGGTDAVKQRDFATLWGLAPWKRFNLSTLGSGGSTFSVEVQYDGEPEFEITGMSIEAVAAARARQAE